MNDASRPPGPPPAGRPPSRRLFWAFAGAMAIAAAGGGLVTLLARQHVAQRKDHPDTIPPARAQPAAPSPAPITTVATPE